ncbi:MAG: GAF domain-containing protein [Bacteroidota bacterium]
MKTVDISTDLHPIDRWNQQLLEKPPIANDPFPFEAFLSLQPLLDFWKTWFESGQGMESWTASALLKMVSEIPELNEPIVDYQVIANNREVIQAMLVPVFAVATLEEENSLATHPFGMMSLFFTDSFQREMLLNKDKTFIKTPEEEQNMRIGQSIYAYKLILEQCYGVESRRAEDKLMIFPIPQEDGTTRFFQANFNSKFIKAIPVGELPELNREVINSLLESPEDLELWQKYLPPSHFQFHGFNIIRFTDVTQQQLVSSMKFKLLENEVLTREDRFHSLQEDLRSLLGLRNVDMGLSYFREDQFIFNHKGYNFVQSLALESQNSDQVCAVDIGGAYKQLTEERKPIVVQDLAEKADKSILEMKLLKLGIKSFILVPLEQNDRIIGVLELTSKTEGSLNHYCLMRLQEVIPLFAVAIARQKEALRNQVRDLIQEEATAIHPSVEWRFNQAALEVIQKQAQGEQATLEPIVFKDVYPLYAATDVRGSSNRRNEAIRADLIFELETIKRALEVAGNWKPMVIFDQITFKVDNHIKYLQKSLGAGDENAIRGFISDEVRPLFMFLKKEYAPIQELIDEAMQYVDPELGVFYLKRKEFEQSLTQVNDAVSEYLVESNRKMQKMFPHYFEKYQTDGVEYNIYVGDSLYENGGYDPIFLKNLRLWQLQTTCEIARLTHEMKPSLPMPLEATHLILVQSEPLAIRFRSEEKQFDVDGAYNIRYEIVKKRIDKAHIKHTDERLTQPNKIAIVYNQARDAAEYREYLNFLQQKGFIEDEIEDVLLEDLQGVQGLRALRVAVKV